MLCHERMCKTDEIKGTLEREAAFPVVFPEYFDHRVPPLLLGHIRVTTDFVFSSKESASQRCSNQPVTFCHHFAMTH